MADVGTLTIRNVWKHYDVKGSGKLEVLNDINLEIGPGNSSPSWVQWLRQVDPVTPDRRARNRVSGRHLP